MGWREGVEFGLGAGVALGWGNLESVADVGPGPEDYMERAYSTTLGTGRARSTDWEEYIAHGRTHGAEGTAGFSSHDGREAWHWEQLRGRGACLEEPTLLWACVPGLLRAGVAVSISRTAIGCPPSGSTPCRRPSSTVLVCPGQHVEMKQRPAPCVATPAVLVTS